MWEDGRGRPHPHTVRGRIGARRSEGNRRAAFSTPALGLPAWTEDFLAGLVGMPVPGDRSPRRWGGDG